MGKTDMYLTNYKTKQSVRSFQEGRKEKKMQEKIQGEATYSTGSGGHPGRRRQRGGQCASPAATQGPQGVWTNRMVCPGCVQNKNSSFTENGQRAQSVGNMIRCPALFL